MIKKLLPIILIGGIVWSGCSRKTEDELFAEAQKYESQEDVKNALKVYEEMVRRFPKSPHADSILQKLGMVYLNTDEQYEKAIATYQRLFDKYPESKYRAQSLFMIGYIYANHIKDFDKAKGAYSSFLEKYPAHELATSVKWEIDHLGKDISDIDIFVSSKDGQTASEVPGASAGKPANSGPQAKP